MADTEVFAGDPGYFNLWNKARPPNIPRNKKIPALRGDAMRRAFFAICGLLFSAQAASAQAPLFNWSGFYLGGNIGWVSQEINGNFISGLQSNHNVSFDTLIGGAHAGFQVQNGNWVMGLEAAYNAFSKKTGESFSVSNDCLPNTANRTCVNSINNLITGGVRIGTASGPWMLFAAGGYATAQLSSASRQTSTGAIISSGPFRWRHGWYAGAGADFMFSPNWIGGIEYRYVELDRETYSLPGVDSRIMGARSHIVQVKLSYLFNGPAGR